MVRARRSILIGLLLGCFVDLPAGGGAVLAAEGEIALTDALVVRALGRSRRSPVHTDPVEARIVAGTWSAPTEGDTVTMPDGSARTWETASAGDDGWLNHRALRGGYAYFSVQSASERVMMLDARGHGLVYVNGEPRTGNPYRTGFVRLPVRLHAGSNDLLFVVRRGGLRATLTEPRKPVMIDTADRTLPDLIIGDDWGVPGAVVVVNASARRLEGLLMTAGGDGLPTRETAVPAIGPMTVRKVPFWCGGAVPPEPRTFAVKLRLERLRDGRRELLDEATVSLRSRRPTDRHRRTFISEIDGSVQYYAVTPMKRPGSEPSPAGRPALFLTLHGAGVEASGQAAAYGHKDWGHIVAPTNRRPYGFDWEDWGRLDAMEVLDLVERRYATDPQRTYLTGHSMGGHGVWHVGAMFPDRFAAIGPSAGWVSFFSYTGAARYEGTDPVEAILRRATSPSDTVALARNYLHHGVYILHGEKDDNVPVEQGRSMNETLGAFHPDLVYHEEAGAGHWWGNRCVDWPAMFEFFAARTAPGGEAIDHVEFVTPNPGISAWSHWVGIEAQLAPLVPSRVVVDLDRGRRRFEATTENVAVLALRLDHLAAGEPIAVTIDGQTTDQIAWPAPTGVIRLVRAGGEWTVSAEPRSLDLKGPHRYGPFKDAFRHRMIFVYGTQGTAEENDWARGKARYDAETFWYRGNGTVDVIADRDFTPGSVPDRSIILYGNRDTNAAWDELIGPGPVVVSSGSIRIGEREITGSDLACLFIRPRPGSERAGVGVVGGSGPAGMRLTTRLPYFVSGVAYPDCIVIGPEMLTRGTEGVRAAGFFGLDWSVETGDFAWRE